MRVLRSQRISGGCSPRAEHSRPIGQSSWNARTGALRCRGIHVGGHVTAVTRRRHRRWRAVGAFLKTIPGALTAIATLTAIAGLLAALAQVGVITIRSPIVANPPAEERAMPDPTAGGGANGSGTAPGGPQGPAVVYLDELTALQESWYRTGARAVNGRDFARSVAIRQPSAGHTETTVFNLGRHYSQLRFTIGLWDDSDPALQSKCQVFADQQVIYDSGTMTRRQVRRGRAGRERVLRPHHLLHPHPGRER